MSRVFNANIPADREFLATLLRMNRHLELQIKRQDAEWVNRDNYEGDYRIFIFAEDCLYRIKEDQS